MTESVLEYQFQYQKKGSIQIQVDYFKFKQQYCPGGDYLEWDTVQDHPCMGK